MLKHKIGDIVTICSVEEAQKLSFFNVVMRELCGKHATITAVEEGPLGTYYNIDIDNRRWSWYPYMFVENKENNKMNKITQIMNILGIEKDVPIDIFDENGDKLYFSPCVFNGEHIIDCVGDITYRYIINIATGEYTFKPACTDKAPTKNTPDDTKVYVRNRLKNAWRPAHFAGMSGDIDYPYTVYRYGMSSFTADDETENYTYAKLAE